MFVKNKKKMKDLERRTQKLENTSKALTVGLVATAVATATNLIASYLLGKRVKKNETDINIIASDMDDDDDADFCDECDED